MTGLNRSQYLNKEGGIKGVSMNNQQLLTIEGVDCVGKTTLAKRIASELGYTYYTTPQLPLSNIRKSIEELRDIETRFFYYLTSVIAVQPELKATLAGGNQIVIDRYVYSTFAMHRVLGATAKCVQLELLPILRPSLGILLIASEEARCMRKFSRYKTMVFDQYIEQETKLLSIAQDEYRLFKELIPIDTTTKTANDVFEEVKLLLGRNGYA